MSLSSQEMSEEAKQMLSYWIVLEGIYFPLPRLEEVPSEGKIPNPRGVKLRSDDVLICTYPKAGTHWLWEVTSMLLLGKAEYESRTQEQLMVERVDIELNQIPSPRVLNTHLPFSMLPVPELKAKGVKIVHIYRNPKDVVVSFYHMQKKIPESGVQKFKPFFEVFISDKALYGNYFDYMRQMNEFTLNNPDVPILNLSYEDMKKCPVENIKEVAKFLGLDVSDSLCEEIEEACRFDNMKNHAGQRQEAVFSDEDKKNKTTSEGMETPKSSYGDECRQTKMYRKGVVGDWKNYLTVAMNEKVDQQVKEKMEGLPFTLQFE